MSWMLDLSGHYTGCFLSPAGSRKGGSAVLLPILSSRSLPPGPGSRPPPTAPRPGCGAVFTEMAENGLVTVSLGYMVKANTLLGFSAILTPRHPWDTSDP